MIQILAFVLLAFSWYLRESKKLTSPLDAKCNGLMLLTLKFNFIPGKILFILIFFF